MRNLKQTAFAVLLLPLMACGGGAQQQAPAETPVQDSLKNQVVETIMTRRSVRQYKPQAVEREKMQTIVECGINAPNAMNKQPWEVRVVDNADYINGVTELYKKANPKQLKIRHSRICSVMLLQWCSSVMIRNRKVLLSIVVCLLKI